MHFKHGSLSLSRSRSQEQTNYMMWMALRRLFEISFVSEPDPLLSEPELNELECFRNVLSANCLISGLALFN